MKVAASSDEKLSFCEATAEYLPKLDNTVKCTRQKMTVLCQKPEVST